MSEGSGESGQQGLKKEVFSCWFFFFEHDRRSELMELNQTRRMPWLIIFRQGLAAVVCFFWQSDFFVTQTARGTPASESLSSSPYVSLFYDFHDLTRDSPNENETVVLRQKGLPGGTALRTPHAEHLAGAPFLHPGEPSTGRRWESAATPVSPSTQRSAKLGCFPVVELCA